jgi:hypothetical protein
MISIDLHYKLNAKGPVEALLRSKDEFQRNGVDLINKGEEAIVNSNNRILMAQQFFITPSILEQNNKIILLERADASISWCRREIKHPNVKKVMKVSILRPIELNNKCWGRYHSYILDPSSTPPCRIELETEDLKKLTPGVSYGTYDVMKRWLENSFDPDIDRPTLIHFAGTTHYGNQHEITRHRTSVMSEIRKIPGNHTLIDGRHIPRAVYDSTMKSSKIVVSPWGFGETAYRDYEALYAGAVLLKPDSNFVNSWPKIFENNLTYIPCSPFWDDLKDKVTYILDNWKSLREMRVKNREILLKYWKEATIVKYYLKIFESVWNG